MFKFLTFLEQGNHSLSIMPYCILFASLYLEYTNLSLVVPFLCQIWIAYLATFPLDWLVQLLHF